MSLICSRQLADQCVSDATLVPKRSTKDATTASANSNSTAATASVPQSEDDCTAEELAGVMKALKILGAHGEVAARHLKAMEKLGKR